jgi:hypothetical protein
MHSPGFHPLKIKEKMSESRSYQCVKCLWFLNQNTFFCSCKCFPSLILSQVHFIIYLFIYLFIYFGSRAWTQGLHLKPLHQPFFVMGFFDRDSWTICLGWLWSTILLISASWVARITGLLHQRLAFAYFLIGFLLSFLFFSVASCPCSCDPIYHYSSAPSPLGYLHTLGSRSVIFCAKESEALHHCCGDAEPWVQPILLFHSPFAWEGDCRAAGYRSQ